MTKERMLYIDRLKALAMIMVVMGHTIYFCMYHEERPDDAVFNIICTFHVPLFFFLSGVVISKLPDNRKVLSKAYRFLKPMLIIGLINAIVIDDIRRFFLDGGHNGYWYLLILTLFYLLLLPFNLNTTKNKYYSIMIDGGIALVIWLAFYAAMRIDNVVITALNPWAGFMFWPFFIIGVFVRKYNILRFLTDYSWLTMLLAALYLTLVIVFFGSLDHLPVALDFSIALIAIMTLIGLFHRFDDVDNWINQQLLLIGNNTLQIYVVHYFFIRFINLDFLIGKSIMIELLTITLLTIAIVYCSIGVAQVMKKLRLPLLLVFATVSYTEVKADNYDPDNYKPENSHVMLQETNLPIVFINTNTDGTTPQVIHKDYRIAARMKVISNANGINYGDTIEHPDQTVDYEGWIGIKYRGNSSFDASPKKPLGFRTYKTKDINDAKQKVAIMGMPKDNNWVLLAPYNDRSMIRDALMFQLARPYFEYVPRVRHCEVILDGCYYGVYIMTEKPTKGKGRLNLDDPGTEGDELTGGYQLEIDRNDEEHWYTSKHYAIDKEGNQYDAYYKIHFLYKHPEYDEMMPDYPQQLEYIHNQIDLMEDALAGDNFKDPVDGYRKYLNPISFIDQQLSQEFANNVDGYRLSTNIYKHRDSVDPLFKTTLWDFNIAFGNADYCNAYLTDFWVYQNTYFTSTNAYQKVPFWWMRLMQDPEYVYQLKERWAEYRLGAFSDEHIVTVIDSLVNQLEIGGAIARNYQAWPVWNRYVWPVPNYQTVNTYEKEIAALKEWIKKRVKWMDEQLDFNGQGAGIFNYTLSGQPKRITGYYTLQGKRIEKPQKGIIIITYDDGSTNKLHF